MRNNRKEIVLFKAEVIFIKQLLMLSKLEKSAIKKTRNTISSDIPIRFAR